MEEEGGRLPGREADVGLGKGQAVKMENKKAEDATERRRERELNIQLGDSRGSVTNRMRNAAVEGRGSRAQQGGQFPGFPSSVRSFSSSSSLATDGSYFQTATEASKRPPIQQNLSESPSLISLARRLQEPARVGDGRWDDRRKTYDSIGDLSVSASVSARRDKGRRRDKWDSATEQSDSETGSGSKASLSEFSLSDRSSLTSSVTAETEISESESGTAGEDMDEEEEVSESETESRSGSEDEKAESSRKSSRGRSYESRRRSGIGGKNGWSSRSTGDSGKHRRGSSGYSSSAASSSRPQTSRRLCSNCEKSERESEENSDVEEERKRVKRRKSSVGRRAAGHVQPVVGSGVMDAPDDLWPIIEEEEKSSVYSVEGREDQEEEGVWRSESAA